MVLVFGMFLVNTLCAVVPCRKYYDPPVPAVPFSGAAPLFPRLTGGPLSVSTNTSRGGQGAGEEQQDPFVITKSGMIQGFTMRTVKGRRIFAFTGIPYAMPPIGQLRYNAPVPVTPWQNVYSATKPSPVCLQVDALQLLRIIGSEDCLYLNIYTPQLRYASKNWKNATLPVLFFIHGGSFFFGSGGFYGPAYLLDRDVILVTVNYRLGALGFLSTGDEAAPGNWALKDQNLALRWVKDNIAYFGGDSSRITLMGQSAGAVSVHLHMLSKQSRGLFHAAISQSGSSFCFWGVRNETVRFTFNLAASLSCPVNDTTMLVQCMRRRDPHLSLYHELKLPQYWIFPGVIMGPVIEPPGPDAFLDDTPDNLYEQGDVSPVPWISGTVANEGNSLGIVTYLYPFVLDRIDRMWSRISHKVLDFDGDIRLITKATYAIRDFYLGDRKINFSNRHLVGNMFGDRLIANGVHRGLQAHSRFAPAYGYFFNYTGKYGYASVHGLSVAEWGISHNDDLIYFVNSSIHHSLRMSDPEYEVSEVLINLWVNFATTREPVYTTDEGVELHLWDPIDNPLNMTMLRIDGDVPEMIPEPYAARIQLWEDLGLLTDSIVGPFNMSNPNMQRLVGSLLGKVPASAMTATSDMKFQDKGVKMSNDATLSNDILGDMI